MTSALAALLACAGQTVLYAQDPIIQTKYTADPAPMLHNDTVFLYTGHDEDDAQGYGFKMLDWQLYTSTDMVNWTDHGAVLSYETFSWAKGDAWAMQCVERGGKFYAYVAWTMKSGGGAIGVAVARQSLVARSTTVGESRWRKANGETSTPRSLWMTTGRLISIGKSFLLLCETERRHDSTVVTSSVSRWWRRRLANVRATCRASDAL